MGVAAGARVPVTVWHVLITGGTENASASVTSPMASILTQLPNIVCAAARSVVAPAVDW